MSWAWCGRVAGADPSAGWPMFPCQSSTLGTQTTRQCRDPLYSYQEETPEQHILPPGLVEFCHRWWIQQFHQRPCS